MTNEEKQLLLKDLCARLPYSVILSKENEQEFFIGVEYGESFITKDVVRKTPQITTERFGGRRFVRDIEEVKPYLRPMSSMTDEEKLEWFQMRNEHCNMSGFNEIQERADFTSESLDWLNIHHFDYRGLILMGLAFEAPKDMYKTK